jgi:lysophospholipase L1-like esterase
MAGSLLQLGSLLGGPKRDGAAVVPPTSNNIIITGDSLTSNGNISYDGSGANYGATVQNSVRGYWTWAAIRLGHRFNLIRNAGVAGNTTTDLLNRLSADVIAYKPGWCVVEIGRNDVSASTSAATIIANLKTIYSQLQAAGIRVVATTITPRDSDSAGQLLVRFTVNRWMKEYARTQPGMVLADFSAAVTDTTSGAWQSGFSYDGLHEGLRGAARMGEYLANALSSRVLAVDLLVNSNADATNLLAGGMMLGTSGSKGTGVTGNVATSMTAEAYSGSLTAVASKVARTDGLPGEWQQIALDPTGSATFHLRQFLTLAGGAFAVGDQVYAQCEFQTDSDVVPNTRFNLTLSAVNSSFVGLATVQDLGESVDTWDAGARIPSGVFRTPVLTVPSGVNDLRCAFRVNGTGTFRVSRMELRKVIAL